jgi:hypothetical protein
MLSDDRRKSLRQSVRKCGVQVRGAASTDPEIENILDLAKSNVRYFGSYVLLTALGNVD